MKTAEERIARALCRLLDDEWRLGKKFYMSTAAEIIADIAYNDLLDALKDVCAILDMHRDGDNGFELGVGNDLWKSGVHEKITAALAKAEGRT